MNSGIETKSEQTSSTIAMTVVKRNGTIVLFHKDRIIHALESAFRDTKKIPLPNQLGGDLKKTILSIVDIITKQVSQLAKKGISLTVEGIQDIVEITLMKTGHHDVARDYIIYRDKHKIMRDDSPSRMKIIRKSGRIVRFAPMKIATAIEAIFYRSDFAKTISSDELVDTINVLTHKVVAAAVSYGKMHTLSVEYIQDKIEEILMQEGFYTIAKEYILYRQTRDLQSAATLEPLPVATDKSRRFTAIEASGSEVIITDSDLYKTVNYACRNLADVSASSIVEFSISNFYEGMKIEEVDLSNIMAAKTLIEKEPKYTQVAARLLLDLIYREVLHIPANNLELTTCHKEYFKKYITTGIALEKLSPDLLHFDLDVLANALIIERDDLFNYLGLQTIYDRYLLQAKDKRLETPQIFWMRVAMGLSKNETEKEKWAIIFYNVLSQFQFVSSTPTLFNSGTIHSQLSSCYLLTVMDDLSNIFKTIADNAQLSKWAGGLGNDWTHVRSLGALIKGTNGRSQGIIPFLKVANDTAVAVNQGGKRKGAMCSYLETWHLDIEDFLELRKNTGDERRRTHDMNTANWIPDLFMKRVIAGEKWTLFNPSDVPDLHDLYGKTFEERYLHYEKLTQNGTLTLYKQIDALTLWRKILSMLFETGHPWITFKDPSNLRSMQDHAGVIHSSNLCTEILLNTSIDEVAVCNLGSVNLVEHLTDNGTLDEAKLEKTIHIAMRMLDNVIDLNFYPIPEAKNANMKHRPVGLGIMGFQDCLYRKRMSYASAQAIEFADEVQELVSYHAILASSKLAKERGKYASFSGSKWDRNLLPIDTLSFVEKERGGFFEVDRTVRLNWDIVRSSVKEHGMRNSHIMAIAPTATISNIVGVTSSIEPAYKNLYVKSNLSGEFTVPNTYLVDELKSLHLWDDQMLDDLKYFDGSIAEIDRIPDSIKSIYLTAFEIDPDWLIECGSRRQKWIDMGQSLNLYLSEPSGKKLDHMYKFAWIKGLKTTYYLRTLSVTQIEKSTTDINRRGMQPRWMKSKSASSNLQVQRTASICSLDSGCESCQ